MSLEAIKTFLLWSFIFNYGILVISSMILVGWRDQIYSLQSRFFPMPIARFDACHFILLGGYKIGIILLTLVPWFALHLLT
ncbi:MAG: hypothetical protein RL333_49 [Pseudomonadota bacterium]|jgi:hypothetical protein